MVDLVYLKLAAGNGGDGKVSFLRSRGITKGGPNGGNGGRGGNVVIKATARRNTLQHFAGVKEFRAESGEKGRKFHQEGPDGKSVVLEVPLGTTIWLVTENNASWRRRARTGEKRLLKRSEVRFQKYYLESATSNPEPREIDEVEKTPAKFNEFYGHQVEDEEAVYEEVPDGKIVRLVTLTEEGEEWVVCQGGFGGLGNDAFKGPSHQTPLEAEYGSFGEQKTVFFEVKALADVGLVGFPNAGKSTLISVLTKAAPKIANYPFTTLEPQLGVLNFDREQTLVIADLPGLIEGASEGKGLGFDFLRHAENCRVLLYVLALDEGVVFAENLTNQEKVAQLAEQWQALQHELVSYKALMAQKKALIVINKIDLADEDLRTEIKAWGVKNGLDLMMVSGFTGENLAELKNTLRTLVKETASEVIEEIDEKAGERMNKEEVGEASEE